MLFVMKLLKKFWSFYFLMKFLGSGNSPDHDIHAVTADLHQCDFPLRKPSFATEWSAAALTQPHHPPSKKQLCHDFDYVCHLALGLENAKVGNCDHMIH